MSYQIFSMSHSDLKNKHTTDYRPVIDLKTFEKNNQPIQSDHTLKHTADLRKIIIIS